MYSKINWMQFGDARTAEYLLYFVGKHAPMVTRLHVCFSSN